MSRPRLLPALQSYSETLHTTAARAGNNQIETKKLENWLPFDHGENLPLETLLERVQLGKEANDEQ